MRNYFMKTDHIGFSKWNSNDILLAQSLWCDPEVTKYICASGCFSKQDANDRLEKEILNQDNFNIQYWPIFCVDTEEFIGCCGLRPYRLDNGIYEIGFHLKPRYWRKGIGTEAAKAVIDYAFKALKANDLFAGHNPSNVGSAAMLKKLGFHHTHDEYYEPTGLNHPSYMYKVANPLITKANRTDLQEILELQYLAYKSEAILLDNFSIPPLKQTLKEVEQEFENGFFLKAIDDNGKIIGSVRAYAKNGTLYIGKLIVHTNYQRQGIGARLLIEIEKLYPQERYELFTSEKSIRNIRFYERLGYTKYKEQEVSPELKFVYLQKQ